MFVSSFCSTITAKSKQPGASRPWHSFACQACGLRRADRRWSWWYLMSSVFPPATASVSFCFPRWWEAHSKAAVVASFFLVFDFTSKVRLAKLTLSELIGSFITEGGRTSEFGMREQTYLVDLWTIHCTTQNASLIQPITCSSKLLRWSGVLGTHNRLTSIFDHWLKWASMPTVGHLYIVKIWAWS